METLSPDIPCLLFHPQEHPGLGAFADVRQSSLRLGSFNLVSGDILCTLQQLHLSSLLRCPSSLMATLQAMYTTPINIIARHRELKTLPSLAFNIPKKSLWIVKVVSHTCTVVFCRFMVWLYMEG